MRDPMEECEICGAKTNTIYVVEVEGARLNVCATCAKRKKVIERIGPEPAGGSIGKRPEVASGEEEVIENYGEAIRKARERLGLPLGVVAEKINEKASTLKRVEEEKTLPSAALTRKLEKELGIKLTSEQQAHATSVQRRHDSPITLWDAAEKKEDKKKQGKGE